MTKLVTLWNGDGKRRVHAKAWIVSYLIRSRGNTSTCHVNKEKK